MTVPGIRKRTVAMLRNVSEPLAKAVADKLGMEELPDPLPKANEAPMAPELERSEYLSLTARPGEVGIRTRKVAVMVAPGVDGASVDKIADALIAEGAVVRLVGPRIGLMPSAAGGRIDVDASFSNNPSPLFDAVVVPNGESAIEALCKDGQALEFVRDQFRHGKAMMAIAEGRRLLEEAGIPIDGKDKGLVLADGASGDGTQAFIKALEQHRHPERETDPPVV